LPRADLLCAAAHRLYLAMRLSFAVTVVAGDTTPGDRALGSPPRAGGVPTIVSISRGKPWTIQRNRLLRSSGLSKLHETQPIRSQLTNHVTPLSLRHSG